MLRLLSILFLLYLSPAVCQAADVKKWVDENGKTHYGARPPIGSDVDTVKTNFSAVQSEVNGDANSAPIAILYSTSWCGFCKKAKAFMQKNNIKYQEYDIEKDRITNLKHKQEGGQGVPFLVLGNRKIKGFKASSYQRFFDLK